MRASNKTNRMTIAILFLWSLAVAPAALAQSLSRDHLVKPDPLPDEMQTLVVGTRFVTLSNTKATANDRFKNLRIATSTFNDTDRCVDQRALELAQDYFETLGRSLSKAGHYYFVPDEEVKNAALMCEKLHGPPQAWVATKTEVIAYGKRVPTTDAAALELSIR
ncbi:MAG: hypothetical protein HOP09_16525 [Hyphomicrobium sp.]|nr:hypothetical protein [Hyphomicrobium sp.]